MRRPHRSFPGLIVMVRISTGFTTLQTLEELQPAKFEGEC